MKCPNCSSPTVVHVFEMPEVITFQNVLMRSYREAITIPRGTMSMYFCLECTFLYNAAFDQSLVGYGDNYENDQTHSAFFADHLNEIVIKIIVENRITRHKILEIGCGNGYFLKKLIGSDNSNMGVGFDKSLKNEEESNRLKLYKKYYTEDDEGDFDVVLSRHVVEHLLDNNSLLSLLRRKNPNGLFFIETPSLEWIIENNAFYDIFYEHCSYFSSCSLSKLMKKNGIESFSVEKVFNNQYLWLEASKKTSKAKKTPLNLDLESLKDFFKNMDNMILRFKSLLFNRNERGKVAIWGAGAKGVTFANLIDPNKKLIECLIDINPQKINKFVPGTGHLIMSPDVLLNEDFNSVIVMNSNYHQEIISMFPNKEIKFLVAESVYNTLL